VKSSGVGLGIFRVSIKPLVRPRGSRQVIGPANRTAGKLDIKLSVTPTYLTYASNDVIMISKYDCFNGKEV
jgi:hypothetical protein